MKSGILQVCVGSVIPGFTTLVRSLLRLKSGGICPTLSKTDGELKMENLGIVSWNKAKLTSRNKYGFKGVRWTRDGSWNAYYYLNKKNLNIGQFDTAEKAARAYDRKAREIWGTAAEQNFPGQR